MDRTVFIPIELEDLQLMIIDCMISTLQKVETKASSSEPVEQFISVSAAADFLNLSVATIYSKVSKGELPVMKQGKRLYFSTKELSDYIKQGKRLSNDEILEAAQEHIKKGGENA